MNWRKLGGFYGVLLFIIGCLIAQKAEATSTKQRRVNIVYPVEILSPMESFYPREKHRHVYGGIASKNQLTCFGHDDLPEPTYIEILGCLMFVPFMDCSSVWGSRTVFVSGNGSIEFLRVPHLAISVPTFDSSLSATTTTASSHLTQPVQKNTVGISDEVALRYLSLNATRWFQLTNVNKQEIIQIPAEPFGLCARSNNWQPREDPHFKIEFNPTYIREKDRVHCLTKILIHVALTIAASSIWLLPYLLSVFVGTISYTHGLKYYVMILMCCLGVVMFTPLMFTRKNRHLARLYFNYFFTRIQAEETRLVIKQRLPLFQAVFFSSLLNCVGSTCAYLIYSYCGVEREWRNILLKATIAMSASWLVFYITRAFERFFNNWIWLVMSVALAAVLDPHLNPHIRVEVVFSAMIISSMTKLSIPRILRIIKGKIILQLAGYKGINLNSWSQKDNKKHLQDGVEVSRTNNSDEIDGKDNMLPDSPTIDLSIRATDFQLRGGRFVGEDFDDDYETYENEEKEDDIEIEDIFEVSKPDSSSAAVLSPRSRGLSSASNNKDNISTMSKQLPQNDCKEVNDYELPLWLYVQRHLNFGEMFNIFSEGFQSTNVTQKNDPPFDERSSKEVHNQSSHFYSDIMKVSDTEILNRRALTHFLDHDLSVFSVGVDPQQELSTLRLVKDYLPSNTNTSEKYKIGHSFNCIYAVGPLKVNTSLLWVPLSLKNRTTSSSDNSSDCGSGHLSSESNSVLETISVGCALLRSSVMKTMNCAIDSPRKTLQFKASTFIEAQDVTRYVKFNQATLRSLVKSVLTSSDTTYKNTEKTEFGDTYDDEKVWREGNEGNTLDEDVRLKLIASALGNIVEIKMFYHDRSMSYSTSVSSSQSSSNKRRQKVTASESVNRALELLIISILEQFPNLELLKTDSLSSIEDSGASIGVQSSFSYFDISKYLHSSSLSSPPLISPRKLISTHKLVTAISDNRSLIQREVTRGLISFLSTVGVDPTVLFDSNAVVDNVQIMRTSSIPATKYSDDNDVLGDDDDEEDNVDTDSIFFTFTFPKICIPELYDHGNLSREEIACIGLLGKNDHFHDLLAAIAGVLYLGALHKLSCSDFIANIFDNIEENGKLKDSKYVNKKGLYTEGRRKDVHDTKRSVTSSMLDFEIPKKGNDKNITNSYADNSNPADKFVDAGSNSQKLPGR